jgi:TPP-dependent indolepyruvate ferredoxin oxidoreductase alpha subunit
MGASIGMARGAAAAGLSPALAVIGDSTFLHSGVTSLMDAVAENAHMTVVILDNEAVGMTGAQPTILPSSRLQARAGARSIRARTARPAPPPRMPTPCDARSSIAVSRS